MWRSPHSRWTAPTAGRGSIDLRPHTFATPGETTAFVRAGDLAAGFEPEMRKQMTRAIKAVDGRTTEGSPFGRPSREDAERAVETLIRWAGDDPSREGLLGTPSRVARAFEEYFAGYSTDPLELMKRTFEEVDGYDEMVLLRDIRFESHCEHHMAPIIGKAHVGYLPRKRVVGISKLARLVDAYANRLQIQEKMTAQIANTINEVLEPRGVGVVIEAAHQCMTTRGVHTPGVTMVTSRMLGLFRSNPSTRREFLSLVRMQDSSRQVPML